MAGNLTALDPFVEIFRRKIFQYVLLMCGQRDDAEEVTQDTLLKIFENLGHLRDPDRVRPWVFRIARNACYTKRRKSQFAPDYELSLESMKPSFREDGGERRLEIADWSALPDAQAANSELREQLRQAIGALPEASRAVLLLRDVEGLSTAETAEVLDVSEDVVKTRLHRARLAVRKDLDGYLRGVTQSGVAQ
jgi:RNA polymerase sigma-70 factor (ECF subfamily)